MATGATERFTAKRLTEHPIIHPHLPGLEGERGANINGPSLIRVPDWVHNPLGQYYLYFAHHGGHYIRLAYADDLTAPWTVHGPGVLPMEDGPGVKHIASPDVLIDEEARQLRMYFHQPMPELGQVSFVALSEDGLRWRVRPEVLGPFYFRVFRHGEWYYAYAKNTNVDGVLLRSPDGLTPFEEGPHFLPGCRHGATRVEGDGLHLFCSLVGDTPERIVVATFDLSQSWPDWEPSEPQVVLEPELPWEGVEEPLEPSRSGAARGPVRQLRDPALFEEDSQLYLLWSGAGEQGIGLARLIRETAAE